MSATSVAGVGVFGGSASADDGRSDQLTERYELAANVNEAVESEARFVRALLESLSLTRDEVELEVETVSEPSGDGEGEIVRVVATADGPTPQLNLVRQTASGPLNVVVYPESDADPFATLTRAGGDAVEVFTPGADGTLETFTDDLTADAGTNHPWPQCPSTCPTDDECCECVRECLSCCNESCTPTYSYGCDCCKYWNPSCWGDCY